MLTLRRAAHEDAPILNTLHNYYIQNTTVHYGMHPETLEETVSWMDAHNHDARYPLFVAEKDGEVIGYGALSPYRPREAYRYTVENSLYLFPEYIGTGAGKLLLQMLIDCARQSGLRTIVAVIDSGNARSISFHERLGFVRCGEMLGIGDKFDTRLSVTYLQYDL